MKHPPSNENTELWKKIFNELHDDIEFAKKDYLIADYMRPVELPQSARRAMIRAIFAFVEGTSYSARQIVLACHDEDLSPQVKMALDEQQVEITNAGHVMAKKIKTSNMNLLRLTVNQFNVSYENATGLECKGPGYEALVALVKVRDRLTHPRSPTDLSVSDSEIIVAAKGLEWYRALFIQMLNIHVEGIGLLCKRMEEEREVLLRKNDALSEETDALEVEKAQLLAMLQSIASNQ
ncbi:hypothetical protein [Pseudomonas sp. LjRoot263]|uniref:hypothetical protein n=1 Tax=Pseudomonas sp. LjRoot263 TaxID=3342302 RepID=UPI003ED0AE9C